MTKIKQHFDSFIIEKDEPKMTLRLIFNVDTEVSARDNLEALVEEYRKNGKATAVFGSNEGVNRVEVTLSEGKDDEEFARIIEDGVANGFEQVETVPVSDGAQIEYKNEYADIQISYEPIDIKDTPEDAFIKKEILQSIINAVYDVDCKNPEKQYLKLFNYRFENGLTQREIAQEMGISQSEVSKRLFKLMDEVKKTFR